MKKILFTISTLQFPLLLCVITFGCWAFDWSKWCYLLLIAHFLAFWLIDAWKPLWFLRWITWPCFKKQAERFILQKSALVAYPAIMFLEINGWEHYKRGGRAALIDGVTAHLEKVRDGLVAALELDARKHQRLPHGRETVH